MSILIILVPRAVTPTIGNSLTSCVSSIAAFFFFQPLLSTTAFIRNPQVAVSRFSFTKRRESSVSRYLIFPRYVFALVSGESAPRRHLQRGQDARPHS